ncbi:MAG: insulinase family protein [Myxococcota bacterium]|nr:insulinase family protein [Myxococcota bacterium]
MSRLGLCALRGLAAAFCVVWCACSEPPRPAAAPPLPVTAKPAAGDTMEPASTRLSTPDAPFRSEPPAAGPAVSWTPPRVDSWSLPNGLRVLFVERHDLPIVAVRVISVIGAGDLGDMGSVRPGAAAFMGAMLEQGAGKRDALRLSDDYEALGAEHGAWCDWDSCVVRAKVLTSKLAPALDLLADIVVRPVFPAAELERTRKRWLASLQQEKNSPPAMEQNALVAALYGRADPYGHAIRGSPTDVRDLKRDDVVRVWRRVFDPRSTTLVVAGDVGAVNLRALLAARFGGWQSLGPPPGTDASPANRSEASRGPAAAARVVLVDVPGAAQSQVFVAEEGAAFGTPDRIPLGVMNAILGGMFSSRINLDLREAHGYTYGAHSRFALRHRAGPFAAGGAIFAEHTGDAVRALLAQITRIRDEAVTAEELADAKENTKLALPARFEGVDDLAAAVQDLAVYHLPLDEYAVRATLVDRVTASDVQRVARQWLRPFDLRIVVTGDRAKIGRDLSSFGPVELRDAYGEIAPVQAPRDSPATPPSGR